MVYVPDGHVSKTKDPPYEEQMSHSFVCVYVSWVASLKSKVSEEIAMFEISGPAVRVKVTNLL